MTTAMAIGGPITLMDIITVGNALIIRPHHRRPFTTKVRQFICRRRPPFGECLRPLHRHLIIMGGDSWAKASKAFNPRLSGLLANS